MRRLMALFIGGLAGGIAFAIFASLHSFSYLLEIINLEVTTISLLVSQISLAFVIGLIFYFLAPGILVRITHLSRFMLRSSQRIPLPIILISSSGLIIGLIIANLLGLALYNIPVIGPYLPLVANLVLGYLGLQLAAGKAEEIQRFFVRRDPVKPEHQLLNGVSETPTERVVIGAVRKILDTSVIIDGRILDLCSTGFLEGPLLLPIFVLEELRILADSADLQKRMRGRRGLDILNQIQQMGLVEVQIIESDFPDLTVDDKLIKLAQQTDSKLITLDYNLSKICTLRKISVLNINELTNALRAVLLPGEEVSVTVIRPGKEPGQGVAYLNDGTMMVVEGGARCVNKTVTVTVTSSLQTAAGRMIFAKIA
ncbi:MAG: TRAM domain-containing protein [Symbiobacteriaceae bacterium]|nr:TRAM domain-containing protein [Symbiobacteriaceae bacterium]